jgi:hypothetical protein
VNVFTFVRETIATALLLEACRLWLMDWEHQHFTVG